MHYSRALCFIFLILFSPAAAHAIPAITCHCFTERSYDPERPAAADPYFLATAQNSFFSQVYGVEKRTIVMKKQRGTSSEDLWIACEVSQKSGVATDTLFDTKQLKKDWKEVIAAHGIDVKKLPKKLQASLLSGASPARLADAVVDDVFLRYRIFNEADLAGMRRSGVTNQEAVLAALLAARSGKPAPSYPAQVKTGVTTWGALMQKEKFEVKDLEREVAQLLRGRR